MDANDSTSTKPVVIVLAAGRGSRFMASGGTVHKLDAMLHGKRILDHVLDAVREAGLAFYVIRADPSRPGMGDSIAAGVRATPGAAGWLVLPGDLPLIRPDTLRAVAEALGTHEVVVPLHGGVRGHPVGFSAPWGAALASLSGEAGAARIVAAARPHLLKVEDAGTITDIDTVADLERASRR